MNSKRKFLILLSLLITSRFSRGGSINLENIYIPEDWGARETVKRLTGMSLIE